MRRWVRVAAVVALAAVVSSTGACGLGRGADTHVRIMVPNSPGSGYDSTARTVARALEDEGILREVEVFNLPGAEGTVGLQRLINERGNQDLLMLMGLGIVGSQYAHNARNTLAETTPIARLLEEPDIVVVPRGSPYQTLDDLITAWRRDPAAIRIGGGSAPGGPDHLAAMLLARASGVAPRETRYLKYDGGGALLAAILSQAVVVGVSGASEYEPYVRSGELRVLAVTSERRVTGLAAPTLREAGVDIVFTNWRGIVAPPGLAEADVARLRRVVDELHASDAWREAIVRNDWTDSYLTGDEFGRFLAEESDRVAKVLGELGLGNPDPTPSGPTVPR